MYERKKKGMCQASRYGSSQSRKQVSQKIQSTYCKKQGAMLENLGNWLYNIILALGYQ